MPWTRFLRLAPCIRITFHAACSSRVARAHYKYRGLSSLALSPLTSCPSVALRLMPRRGLFFVFSLSWRWIKVERRYSPTLCQLNFPFFLFVLPCLRSGDFFFWCGQHNKRLNWHSEVSKRLGQVALVVVPHFRLLFKLAKNSPSWLRTPNWWGPQSRA